MPFTKLVYDYVNSIVTQKKKKNSKRSYIPLRCDHSANRTKCKAGLKLTYQAPSVHVLKDRSKRYTHIYGHLCVDAYERLSNAVIQM